MTAISNSTNRANTKTARLGRSGSVVRQNLIAARQNLIAARQSLIGLIVAVSSSRWHIAYCCYQVQLNRNIRLRRNAEKLRSRVWDLSWRTRPPDLLGGLGQRPSSPLLFCSSALPRSGNRGVCPHAAAAQIWYNFRTIFADVVGGNGIVTDYSYNDAGCVTRIVRRDGSDVLSSLDVASSKGTTYFNDLLGTTVGAKSGNRYSAAALSAFGERLDKAGGAFPAIRSLGEGWFTGKPTVAGLGHAFLMRNYRASLGKWQTADPMGYPENAPQKLCFGGKPRAQRSARRARKGPRWNQLAYCNNGVTSAVDIFGGELKVIGHTTEEAPMVKNDMGTHVHIDDDGNGHDCHWYRFDFYEYKVTIMQDFIKKRRWELVDGWENVLNGFGYGCDTSGGYLTLTGAGTAPGAGFLFAGILFHTAAGLVDYLNYWVEVPNGEPIRVRDTTPTYTGSVEGHAYE